MYYSTNKKEFSVNGINTELLNSKVNKFVLHRIDLINNIIGRLLADKSNKNTNEKILVHKILNNVGKKYIINLCMVQFLTSISHQHIEDDKNSIVVSVILGLGGKLINRYKNYLNYNE